MEKEATRSEEEGGLKEMEEAGGERAGEADGRGAKLSRFMKVYIYLPLKEVIVMDELRIKLMKQGQDVTRSRLISEAIRLLAKEGVEAKIGSRV